MTAPKRLDIQPGRSNCRLKVGAEILISESGELFSGEKPAETESKPARRRVPRETNQTAPAMPLANKIKLRAISALIPYAQNARTHSPEQVDQIVASIREFGFTNPVLVDGAGEIVAGHGRVLAAGKLGLARVPTIDVGYLTTRPGRHVLDPFCGSGTTIVVSEMTGRIAHAIEIEPRYVDVAVRRWQKFTGAQATLESDGRTFAQIEAERLALVAAE